VPTIFLDLADLDKLIHELETEWKADSIDMLRDQSVRSRIPEHVLLRWETYIRQRLYLREYDREIHADYLSRIPRSKDGNRLTPKELSELAA